MTLLSQLFLWGYVLHDVKRKVYKCCKATKIVSICSCYEKRPMDCWWNYFLLFLFHYWHVPCYKLWSNHMMSTIVYVLICHLFLCSNLAEIAQSLEFYWVILSLSSNIMHTDFLWPQSLTFFSLMPWNVSEFDNAYYRPCLSWIELRENKQTHVLTCSDMYCYKM